MRPRTTTAQHSALGRSMVKAFAFMVVAASALAFMPQARASAITYTFTQYTGSGTPTASPYGTVTLTQDGNNVNVSVSLAGSEGFVDTNAGESLLWDLSGTPFVTITHLTNGFSVTNNATKTGSMGGTGYWYYGITCHGTACGHGGSSPYTGTLSFTVENVTTSDFIANGSNFYFASDICTVVSAADKCTFGVTGDIAAPGPGVTTNVPEPATFALFAAGLAALGFGLRRRARQS